MRHFNILLLLLGAALITLWAGDRLLATGLLLGCGLWARYLQHREVVMVEQMRQWAEEQTCDERVAYPQLILTALGWAASGKTAYVPPGEDPHHPRLVYIGHRVPNGLGKGQTFLPEIEVTERSIQAVQALGAVAGREA